MFIHTPCGRLSRHVLYCEIVNYYLTNLFGIIWITEQIFACDRFAAILNNFPYSNLKRAWTVLRIFHYSYERKHAAQLVTMLVYKLQHKFLICDLYKILKFQSHHGNCNLIWKSLLQTLNICHTVFFLNFCNVRIFSIFHLAIIYLTNGL